MSSYFKINGRKCYLPKARIKRKLEKPGYRERYEKHVNGRAEYNSPPHNKLCWIWCK